MTSEQVKVVVIDVGQKEIWLQAVSFHCISSEKINMNKKYSFICNGKYHKQVTLYLFTINTCIKIRGIFLELMDESVNFTSKVMGI
jgi:hypothetical protein